MDNRVAQVRRHLAEIPDLVAEASHYLTPGSAPKDPDARHGTTVFRIPIVPEIVDLLDERDKLLDDIMLNRTAIAWEDGAGRKVAEHRLRRLGVLPTLGLWVALVHAELEDLGRAPESCCPARGHTLAGEVAWLVEWAEAVIELHDDFPRDIELLWQELRRACRVRQEYIPQCPKCGHRLEGVYGSESDKEAAWFRCTGCPQTFVMDAELKRLAALQPPMTLRQIAGVLRLSCRDVYGWYRQDRYMPVGTNARGQRLFELEHVKRAALSAGRAIEAA